MENKNAELRKRAEKRQYNRYRERRVGCQAAPCASNIITLTWSRCTPFFPMALPLLSLSLYDFNVFVYFLSSLLKKKTDFNDNEKENKF